VLDIPGIEKSVGPVPMGASYYAEQLRETKKKQALEHIEAMLKKFKGKCEKEGVAFREALVQGGPSDTIVKKSIFFDLIIAGQRISYDFGDEGKHGISVEKILDSSVTPILAVPDNFKPVDRMKTILAFDGSLPAARSMQRFAALMTPYAGDLHITILTADKYMESAQFYLDHAELYLRAHGYKNVAKEWTPKNIIDAFEAGFYDENDLIVVGMHSKNLLADFFIGSLIKYLLHKGEKPVLLGQ